MTGKFSFLYIIVAIVICVSISVVSSGKVNAADGSATILVSEDNDQDALPPSWQGIGEGGGVDDVVTICHQPDTSAEMTLTIPESALEGHLGHGDFIGSCDEPPSPSE
jgi:hypothetical protein